MIAYIKKNLFNNLSTKQSLLKNSFWRFFGILPNKVVRLVIVMLAAKELGPELFGNYNYLVALTGMAFIVSDWGINILLIRDYQQRADKDVVVSTSFVARFLILFLALVVSVIILLFNRDSAAFLPGIIIALTFVIGNFKELFVAIFLAVQKAELEAKVYFFDSFLSLAIFVLIFYFKASVINFSLSYFLASLLVMFIAWFYSHKIIRISLKNFDKTFFKLLIKNGLPLSLFGILGYIFFATDQLFLKHYAGYEAVGHYALATKLILAMQVLPSLINSVLLPILSRNIGNKQIIKKSVYLGMAIYGGAGLLISGLIYFATPLFISFFGDKYLASSAVIQYLSPILIFMFMVTLLDYVLVAYNLQKQDFYLTMVAAIVNLVLLYFLVPTYGLMGAVWSSLISQALNFILTFGFVLKVIKNVKEEKYESLAI